MPGISSAMAVRPHLPLSVGYTTGKYYGPSFVGVVLNSTVTLTAGRDYFVPFLCRRSKSFDRIALRNTAAVATTFRLAVYADDGGGHPGALVEAGSELTCGGAAGDNAATLSATSLTGGTLYWLAFNCNSNLAVPAVYTNSGSTPAYDNAADFPVPDAAAVNYGSFPYSTRAYAAFPSTATAWSDMDASAPLIRLRAA